MRSKAKAAESSTRNDPVVVMDNPWSLSDSASPRPARPQFLPPLSPLPPSSVPSSSNQTPYSDFARAASATTSFYGRFNESASFPTPHAMYDSPLIPNIPLLPAPASPAVPDAPSFANRQEPSRPGSAVSDRQDMDIDWTVNGPVAREGLGSSAARRPSLRHGNTDFSPRPDDSAGPEASRRLRDILSDPTSPDRQSRPWRRPTVEDVPEEGELDLSTRTRSRSRSPEDWHASSLLSRRSLTRDDYSNPSGHRSRFSSTFDNQRDSYMRSTRPSSSPCANQGRVSSAPRHYSSPSQPGEPFDFQPTFTPPGPGSRHSFRDADRASRDTSHTEARAMPSPRSLDVFDLVTDDNMPEAVRRNTATTEREDIFPTPIPHEGDPEVHRHDPEAHLLGMSDEWVQEVWSDPSGTSLTISTFNPRFSRSYGTNRRTATDLRQAVARITGESSFSIIAPDLATGHRGRGPVEWAVTGLTTDGVDLLLRRRVWSFKTITFFPRSRSLINPSWILALEGFLEDNADTIRCAVRSTFERPQLRLRVEQMIRTNPEFVDIPLDEAFRRIMATLRVTVYTLDNDTVVAN
ncbi:hypothetical protein K466DRAFT_607374, partial [Polyporus arcularius HHB13444]